MKLFEVIPPNFFSILTSPNREIYYDALVILLSLYQDELNIKVDDYISSLNSMLEGRSFEYEEEEESSGGKARLILNRLIQTGWLDREYMEKSFTEIIIPRSYAIPVIKLLTDLGSETAQQYTSLVFATYSALEQAYRTNPEQLYEAILAAKTNTEALKDALRAFHNNIRSYLRGIIEDHSVNDLLEEHFIQYKDMADRILHPIKTIDSVYRYTGPIQTILSEILNDEDLLAKATARGAALRRTSEAKAQQEVIGALDYVLDSYLSLGTMMGEIDRKHTSYTRSSIEKISYLMTADATVKGRLTELLTAFAKAPAQEQERIYGAMEEHIETDRVEFFDGGSLYHKNIRNRRVEREPLPLDTENQLPEGVQDAMLRQLGAGYPAARIRQFVEGLFKDGQQTLKAREIPLENDTDFILIMLTVIRSGERGMPYSVTLRPGQLERNGYRIPDFELAKKEERHVE